MNFARQAFKRILEAIPTLFGLSLLIFAMTRLIPGDPVRLALGPNASDAQVQQLRREMGLDEPLYVQYVDWLVGVFQADWGMSLQTDNNVYADVAATLPATVELVVFGLAMAVALAVPFGVIAATNKDQWQDYVSRFGALIGVSMPKFWLGIILQVVVAVHFGLLPLSGRISGSAPPTVTHFYLIDSLIAGQLDKFVSAVRHLILPGFVLGVGTLAQVMRLLRSDMISESRKDYILAARAYGLPRDLIVYKYMLRNAFSSSLTVIGLALGLLIGGAFVVEIVFAWPGMARYGVRAIQFQDFNAVVAVVMVIGTVYLATNLVVDLLYRILDPRIGLESD